MIEEVLRQKARVARWARLEQHSSSAVLFAHAATLFLCAARLTQGLHLVEVSSGAIAAAGALLAMALLWLRIVNGIRHRVYADYRAIQARAAQGD